MKKRRGERTERILAAIPERQKQTKHSKLLLIPFVNKNYSSYSNKKGGGEEKSPRLFNIPEEHSFLILKNQDLLHQQFLQGRAVVVHNGFN